MQLLQQFYKPTRGQIMVNDQSIERFDLHELRQKTGVVNQEPVTTDSSGEIALIQYLF
jgi:ABC-type multidrug transport system fused ATPase/permease subunit